MSENQMKKLLASLDVTGGQSLRHTEKLLDTCDVFHVEDGEVSELNRKLKQPYL